LRGGGTSSRDRLHRDWNDLPAKAMSERFGNLQTFKAPAAKLPPGEALKLSSALDGTAVPIQLVHGIKAAAKAAVRGGDVDDEQILTALAAGHPFLRLRRTGHGTEPFG